MGRAVIVGVDLGGTKVAAAPVTAAGDLAGDIRVVPTGAAAGVDAVLRTLLEVVAGILADLRRRGEAARGVAVATPGFVDPETGDIPYATPALPGWADVRLRQRLESAAGVPAFLINDGQAAAWGEFRRGAGRGTRDMLMVTVGTGIGGGAVVGGQLLRGACGASARIGHVSMDTRGPVCYCGGYGCLELYASGSAMARAACEAIRTNGAETALAALPGPVTGAAVLAAAASGDRIARAIVEEAAVSLGAGLAVAVNLLNPSLIIVGGGVARAGALVLEPAEAAMQRRLPPPLREAVRVRPAELWEAAGIVGVALLAWERWG